MTGQVQAGSAQHIRGPAGGLGWVRGARGGAREVGGARSLTWPTASAMTAVESAL